MTFFALNLTLTFRLLSLLLSISSTVSFPEPVYKSSCSLTVHAISHYSPDVLKGHAGVALPLAFLGMHQAPGPDEEKGESHDATLWAEVWQENVPGNFFSRLNAV